MTDVGTTEKIANENHWNLVSITDTEPEILLGVIYPSLVTYVIKQEAKLSLG